jgi:hypothetical protein
MKVTFGCGTWMRSAQVRTENTSKVRSNQEKLIYASPQISGSSIHRDTITIRHSVCLRFGWGHGVELGYVKMNGAKFATFVS